ncbi:MAG: hypothetical protein WC455_25160 [Dehalococcoidia bacterium]
MRVYTEIPCNRYNARFVIAPEFERDRATLQEICARSESYTDLLAELQAWTLRERAVSQRRIDIGLLQSQIGSYNTLILTEVKTIIEAKLVSTE